MNTKKPSLFERLKEGLEQGIEYAAGKRTLKVTEVSMPEPPQGSVKEVSMISDEEIEEFKCHLAETIAWCNVRALVIDPRNSLRTPTLRPSNLSLTPDQWGIFDYKWDSLAEKQGVVSVIAAKRGELLRAANAYPDASHLDLAGGRLLVAAPEDSDHCCLSESSSEGFIDALDIPAWDTWICYKEEAQTPNTEKVWQFRATYGQSWQPRTTVSYLLCWIPAPFCCLVDDGIAVNPVECFFWANE